METKNYPITIDKKEYFVERTFDGSPAIFWGKSFKHIGHVYDRFQTAEADRINHEVPLTEGMVLILARTIDQTK